MLYCVFLFLVINRSVAGVVFPAVGAHYPVAGVILTVVEEIHLVAVVTCPVARVMHNCVAQVTSSPQSPLSHRQRNPDRTRIMAFTWAG